MVDRARRTQRELAVHRRRETLVWRLMAPPAFEDENRTAVAGGVYAIGWTLLLIVCPLLLVLAWLVPSLAAVSFQIALGLCVVSSVALYLAHREQLNAASLWLVVASWLLFSWVVWVSGGLRSAAVASLFVVVILAGAVRGWRWGTVAAATGVATVLFLAWAANSGALPRGQFDSSPWTSSATYAAYFVALGALQGVMAINAQRTRDRANAALAQRRAAEQRLLDVVENAPFGAVTSEMTESGSLRVTHVNRAATEVLGIDATRFVGGTIGEAFWALSGDRILARFEDIAGNGGAHHAETVPFYAGNRRGILEMQAFQIAEGSMAVFFSDVTERRRVQVEMHHMAFHDELTALPNRKLLLDRLEMALAGARRRGARVALLFIDLDDFKPINDRYGHSFGDELLVAVGTRLRNGARRADTVARFGGDEFTVLMPDLTAREQVVVVAEKLLAAFRTPFEVDGRSVGITASIGIGVTGADTLTAEALVERADAAMYQVKRAGRNGYRINDTPS